MTLPEIARRVESNERRFADHVRVEVYDRDMKELREDISEIKSDMKWATRFIAGQFVTLVVALILWALDRIPI